MSVLLVSITKSSFSKGLIQAAFVLAAVYAVLVAGYSINLVTALLLLGIFGVLLFSKQVRLPKTIFIAGVAFLLFMALSSLFSISPRRSFEQTWIILCAGFVIIGLANIRGVKSLRELTLLGLLIAGLFWMILSWRDTLQWYSTWRQTAGSQGILPDLPFRLNGGNTIAAFYSILFFISLVLVIRVKASWIRAVMAIYLISVSVLLFLSTSRGAWVGMFIGVIALLIFEKQFIFKAYHFVKKSRILSIVVILVFIAGVAGFLVLYQKYVASHPTHGGGVNRAPYWNPAWLGFLKSPIIGNGPYTGGSFFIPTTSIPWNQIYLHAHNTYLDILRDTGILGFLSFISLLVLLIIKLIKVQRGNRENYFAEIALCAAVAFFSHSIFDGNYLMPFAATSMLLLIGVALNPSRANPTDEFNVKPYAAVIGLLVLGGAAYLLWNRSLVTSGIRYFRENKLQQSAELLEKSKRLDRGNPIPYVYHGLIAARLGAQGQTEFLSAAIQDFETTVRLDPTWAVNYANLAALYQSAGKSEQAEEYFNKSSLLSPGWYVPSLNLGLIYESKGDLPQAGKYYRSALSAYPDIANSSFWLATDFRSELIGDWLADNPPTDYTLQDAQAIFHQDQALPMIRLGSAVVDTNVDLSAQLLLRSELAYAAYPYISAERQWLEAEIMAEKSEIPAAIAAGESAIAAIRSDGLFGPGSAGTSQYSDGLYRAPVLPVDFIPQLVTIPLPGDWENRYIQLAAWYMDIDNAEACQTTIDNLLSFVPDSLAINRRLLPCTGN